ncbi:MAG: hypothetical protein AB1847_12810 [bacterium]
MRKTLIFTLILFILLAGCAWLLFTPYVAGIQEVRQKIEQTRKRTEMLRHLYRQSEEIERKAADFQRDIQYLSRYLPSQEEISAILNKVRAKGMEYYGLNMVKADSDYSLLLEGAGILQGDKVLCLEAIPFKLQAEGPLPNICSYLEWLEGLPCFLSIDNLQVSRLGDDSLLFPLLRATILLKVMGLVRKGKESIGHLRRESDVYYPVRLSPSLITAQKNLRVTALEKDLFSPEEGAGSDGYASYQGVAGGSADETPFQDGFARDGLVKGGTARGENARGEDSGGWSAGGEGAGDWHLGVGNWSLGTQSAEGEDDESWGEEKGGTSIQDLDFTGIVNYQGEYTALINNRRVKKGDGIAGMEVMWITKDSICLSKGRDKFILRLNQ